MACGLVSVSFPSLAPHLAFVITTFFGYSKDHCAIRSWLLL